MIKIKAWRPIWTEYRKRRFKKYLEYIFTSETFTEGELKNRLEERLAEITGYDYVVCCSSATQAFEALLLARGDKRIYLQGESYPSFYQVAKKLGRDVHLVEMRDDIPLMKNIVKPEEGEVVVPVGLFGLHYAKEVEEIANKCRSDRVIYDAAGLLNAFTKRDTWCENAVLSFHATTLVGAGEGGAVLTDDQRRYIDIRAAVDAGRYGRVYKRYGTMAVMDEMTAAMILSGLDELHDISQRVVPIWAMYYSRVKYWKEEGLPVEVLQTENMNYTYFAVKVPDARKVESALAKVGIECRRTPAFNIWELPCYEGSQKLESKWANRVVLLPMDYRMGHAEINYVLDNFEEVLKNG